jgi:hypothetical protein
LGSTIDRLRAIAAEAGHAMLTDGPVHADHELLELCGDALHLIRKARRQYESREALRPPLGHNWAEADRQRHKELYDVAYATERRAVTLLRRAKKIRATSAAGVFAKALIVRASTTGAKELAMTLAEDLINCPGRLGTPYRAAGADTGRHAPEGPRRAYRPAIAPQRFPSQSRKVVNRKLWRDRKDSRPAVRYPGLRHQPGSECYE